MSFLSTLRRCSRNRSSSRRPVSPMYIFFNNFNLVDITKLPFYPHRHSNIVSLETFTFYSLITKVLFNLELKGEDGWTKLNYAEHFDTSLGTVKDNVPRQDCNKISKSEFVERFEKPRIPVVLTHTMDHWKSMRKWTVEVC